MLFLIQWIYECERQPAGRPAHRAAGGGKRRPRLFRGRLRAGQVHKKAAGRCASVVCGGERSGRRSPRSGAAGAVGSAAAGGRTRSVRRILRGVFPAPSGARHRHAPQGACGWAGSPGLRRQRGSVHRSQRSVPPARFHRERDDGRRADRRTAGPVERFGGPEGESAAACGRYQLSRGSAAGAAGSPVRGAPGVCGGAGNDRPLPRHRPCHIVSGAGGRRTEKSAAAERRAISVLRNTAGHGSAWPLVRGAAASDRPCAGPCVPSGRGRVGAYHGGAGPGGGEARKGGEPLRTDAAGAVP